jgi:hypothetical protein
MRTEQWTPRVMDKASMHASNSNKTLRVCSYSSKTFRLFRPKISTACSRSPFFSKMQQGPGFPINEPTKKKVPSTITWISWSKSLWQRVIIRRTRKILQWIVDSRTFMQACSHIYYVVHLMTSPDQNSFFNPTNGVESGCLRENGMETD